MSDDATIASRMEAYERERAEARVYNIAEGHMKLDEAPTLEEWHGCDPQCYDTEKYGPLPVRDASGSLQVLDAHRQYMLDSALMLTSPAFMAKQFGISVRELFVLFGEIIEHAFEIFQLQTAAISHVIALNPEIAPDLEEEKLRVVGIARNDDLMEDGSGMAKHWGEYFDIMLMPEWKKRERPPLPAWYFDVPGLGALLE